MTNLALVGDIGGTHARFALADLSGDRAVFSGQRDFASSSFRSGRALMEAYLSTCAQTPDVAALAVAGPVTQGAVHFTNLGWSLSVADVKACGVAQARLVNDFEAMALATEFFTAEDVGRIGAVETGAPDASVAVIGPGTGFGAGALVKGDGKSVVMASEGGHASFAPGDDVEREVLRILAAKYDHVSIERVLSGPGLEHLHVALDAIEGRAGDAVPSDAITRGALAGDKPFVRTLARFCAILGSVAGDFALAYGARGGVFIAGGIAPAILSFLETSEFRRRFEAKGRFQSYLQAIPTKVILHGHAAFLGDAAVARALRASQQT